MAEKVSINIIIKIIDENGNVIINELFSDTNSIDLSKYDDIIKTSLTLKKDLELLKYK